MHARAPQPGETGRMMRVGIAADQSGYELKSDLSASLRAVALCGSGVGASVAANKVPGVRAGLIHDVFSAHQGVEDDDMNVFCLGGKVTGSGLALELIETFLHARFSGAARDERRLAKVHALETGILES